MYFASNIKLLRKRKGRTQDDVAHALDIKRSTLSGYENGIAEPGMKTLLDFARYYKVSVDTLIKVDLSGLLESQLSQLERGDDVFITGSNLRILATTVDTGNNDNVELVSEKAKAGYATGFADPDYIRILPTFNLPFLRKDRKYRMFQVSGDSMLPIPDKAYVTGEYVDDWHFIKDQHPYIILTVDEGVVFKIVENRIEADEKLLLHSLNPLYEPFEVHIKDIREVWKFIHYISNDMPEPNMPREELVDTVIRLQKQVREIQTKLDLPEQ
jgi:transcriptional regulator with XRE-family HTH domain